MKLEERKYLGVYQDKQMLFPVEIYNNSEVLTFQIGKYRFAGTQMDDFELQNPICYSAKELRKFSWNKLPHAEDFCYTLSDYNLSVFIPIQLITKRGKEKSVILKLRSSCGSPQENGGLSHYAMNLALIFFGKTYTGEGAFFEDAVHALLQSTRGEFSFKSCFGCQFSDYSVFGQGAFGTMLCFKNQKKKYLAVTTKAEYMALDREDRFVQETFLCEEFEARGENVGYRG